MTNQFQIFNSNKLDPFDFMGLRGKTYKPDLFFNHKIYDNIKNSILNKPLTLIIGNPISGKTRIVYDTLKELDNYRILKANSTNIEKSENYIFDTDNSKTFFIFDDVDEFFGNPTKNEKTNKLLFEIIKNGYKCVLTCRTGPEFTKFKKNIDKHILNEIFDSNYYWIPRFSINYKPLENFLIKNQNKFRNKLTEFDGNIGSLLLPLSDMRKRFEQLQINEERIALAILLGLKLHYHFYNYEGSKREYNIDKIKYFCKQYLKEEITQFQWDQGIRKLLSNQTELNFIEVSDNILIEEVYLDIFKDKEDIVFNDYNKKRLFNLLKDNYDYYNKKAYGFPLSTSDYNEKIMKAKSFEEGFEIFKEISNPNAYSFIALMKLTNDTEKLYEIYKQMRSVKRINEFFIPHNIIINMFHSFKDLLFLLKKVDSRKLYNLNGTTNRLIKLAKKEPKKSLKILFETYDKKVIYSNPAFNQLVLICVEDEEDFIKYIKPILPIIDIFDYPLRKNIIKACIKLNKYQIASKLVEKYLVDYDYYNEMGNCLQFSDSYKAIKLHLKSLNFVNNEHDKLKAYININRIIYNNNIQQETMDIIKESHTYMKEKFNFFKKSGSFSFKFLQKYVVLNEIATLNDKEKIKKLRFLFSKFYISVKGKNEILKELDNKIVTELTK